MTTGNGFGISHLHACSECGELHCESYDHIRRCHECDDPFCDDHVIECAGCGDPVCDPHSGRCTITGDVYGDSHLATCIECGVLLSRDHAHEAPATDGYLCVEHFEQCEFCRQEYAPTSLVDGRCPACRNLSPKTEANIDQVSDAVGLFGRSHVGKNDSYIVVRGKHRIRGDIVIVYSRDGTQVHKRRMGIEERFGGWFK
ncbi:hypothetical protein [Halopenitus malekzadehii]|uniref:hypothetical protein n=1 Tax=Halopenitus malekzadehii TaxID=1267564 RepID=UPI000B868F41|nr:hypothetical protein [Halopenitus malekzadehii]